MRLYRLPWRLLVRRRCQETRHIADHTHLRLHLFCTKRSLQAVRYVDSLMTSKFWAPDGTTNQQNGALNRQQRHTHETKQHIFDLIIRQNRVSSSQFHLKWLKTELSIHKGDIQLSCHKLKLKEVQQLQMVLVLDLRGPSMWRTAHRSVAMGEPL